MPGTTLPYIEQLLHHPWVTHSETKKSWGKHKICGMQKGFSFFLFSQSAKKISEVQSTI